jgi:hypothetical protein
VSTEVVVLALSTVVRPTSAAAVLAILSTPRPQRLLVAYIIAGLVFSLSVGALVVLFLQGISGEDDGATRRPLVEVLVGGLALGYAAAVGIGWLPRRRDPEAAPRAGGMRERLQDPSPRGAAAAGVLTHLPGLIYLAALNAIAGNARGALDAMVQVAIYNAIWFSLAIAALVMSIRRPEEVRDLLVELRSWVHRHSRVLVVVGATAVGSYFMVIGLRGLVPHLG